MDVVRLVRFMILKQRRGRLRLSLFTAGTRGSGVDSATFLTGLGMTGDGGCMQTNITDDDTLKSLNVKLNLRRVVLLQLTYHGRTWRALASRTDTLRPAVARGRCPAAAVRRVAACLDPVGA